MTTIFSCTKCQTKGISYCECQGSESVLTTGSSAACIAKDRAIVNLYMAIRALSDYGADALTDQDVVLWGYVIGHDAVQSRIKRP